jgi:hypothetical protein
MPSRRGVCILNAMAGLARMTRSIAHRYLNTFHNDLSTQTADGSWALPIPATFVIDRNGVIQARHVAVDYRTRMDPDDIETALSELGEAT